MKKKSLWLKIFSFVMIVCFAITCTGCIFLPSTDVGDDGGDGELDFPEVGGFTEDLLGSKILYRPDNYDYDQGSGAEEGTTNDYYGQYAYRIMEALYNIYGIVSNNYINNKEIPYLPNFASEWIDSSHLIDNFMPYLYDSIRYQVNTIGQVNKMQLVETDSFGNIVDYGATVDASFYIIGANPNVKWNWTIEPNTTSAENIKAYIYYADTEENDKDGLINIVNQDDNIYVNTNNLNLTPNDILNDYYGDIFQSDYYEELYLSSSEFTNPDEIAKDFEHYSDYVKTLEYVIYCYAIDLEPAQVTVTTKADGTYEVRIGDFQSVDDALNSAKNTFKILGSYVGLVDRQITKIENWIIDNIIGETAVNADDMFFDYYTDVLAYVTLDENNQMTYVKYNFDKASVSNHDLGRDYENAVRNIVDGVCSLVKIGDDDGEDVTIDDRFLASEIIEYAGDTYAVSDDTQFPVYVEGAQTIRPLEYQSVALMMKNEVYVSGLWIALKYDAGLDGTTAEDLAAAAEDPEHAEYIDVIVDLNYYNHATNTRTVIDSKQVRVYDGSYDMNYLRGFEGQEGSLADPDNGYIAPDDHSSGVVFDGLPDLHVNPFNPNIGEGILMTDVGSEGNYEGNPIVSTEPLVLVGTTDVRKYYEVVEYGTNPEFDKDELPEGYTYISGRFNPNMFSGDDGCDYLEVTFKVLKEVGNTEKNYKFYTGIANIMLDEKPVMTA